MEHSGGKHTRRPDLRSGSAKGPAPFASPSPRPRFGRRPRRRRGERGSRRPSLERENENIRKSTLRSRAGFRSDPGPKTWRLDADLVSGTDRIKLSGAPLWRTTPNGCLENSANHLAPILTEASSWMSWWCLFALIATQLASDTCRSPLDRRNESSESHGARAWKKNVGKMIQK
jgi:hypothetical protein